MFNFNYCFTSLQPDINLKVLVENIDRKVIVLKLNFSWESKCVIGPNNFVNLSFIEDVQPDIEYLQVLCVLSCHFLLIRNSGS